MSYYKWIAFTQKQLERMINIILDNSTHKVSDEYREIDLEIYTKIKKVAERKEDDITFEPILGDP